MRPVRGHRNDRGGLRVAVRDGCPVSLDLRLHALGKRVQSDPHSATADNAPALLT